jgi:hypothetical protein
MTRITNLSVICSFWLGFLSAAWAQTPCGMHLMTRYPLDDFGIRRDASDLSFAEPGSAYPVEG